MSAWATWELWRYVVLTAVLPVFWALRRPRRPILTRGFPSRRAYIRYYPPSIFRGVG